MSINKKRSNKLDVRKEYIMEKNGRIKIKNKNNKWEKISKFSGEK
jgi:hypothetical protein